MESVIFCKHGTPCYIKTSTKDGPKKKKSFYVCGPYKSERCNFVKESTMPAMLCPDHPGSIVDLQTFSIENTKRELRRYYRCVGRDVSQKNSMWCGYIKMTEKDMQKENPKVVHGKSNSSKGERLVQPLGDRAKISQENRRNVDVLEAPNVSKQFTRLTKHGSCENISNSDKLPVSVESVPHMNINNGCLQKPFKDKSIPVKDNNATKEMQPTATNVETLEHNFNKQLTFGDANDETRAIKLKNPVSEELTKSFELISNGAKSSSSSVKSSRNSIYMGSRRESTTALIVSDDDDDEDDCFIVNEPVSKTSEHIKTSSKASSHSSVGSSTSSTSSLEDSAKHGAHGYTSFRANSSSYNSRASNSSSDASVMDDNSDLEITDPDKHKRSLIKDQMKIELQKKRDILKMCDLSKLPDGGVRLNAQIKQLEKTIAKLILSDLNDKKTEVMNTQKPVSIDSSSKAKVAYPLPLPRSSSSSLRQTQILSHAVPLPPHVLQQMYAANPQSMTLYGGRMTKSRLHEVGTVTTEALETLHKQLETCPSETTELDDPDGLHVTLMPHQKQALAWLTWREKQEPAGGILADDMGLGKTLTMISLIMKIKQASEETSDTEWLSRREELKKVNKSLVPSHASLVVAPASLIHQWNKEIEKRCHEGQLKVLVYHGPNRDRDPRRIAKYDVVITTYSIVSKEVGAPKGTDGKKASAEAAVTDEQVDFDGSTEQPAFLRIAWERIILDEGHNIKNHKSLTAMSVCRLRAVHRWVLTGTPIQNDLLDMYSLLRFLRCSPFDEYKVWKRQVENKSGQGTKRLNIMIKSLLLRRTKSQSGQNGKPLVKLPERFFETHELSLSADEKTVYEKIFSQSKSMLQEYLQKQEIKERGHTSENTFSKPLPNPGTGNSQFANLNLKQNTKTTAAGGSQILLLLLRLRQACCHLSLMKDAFEIEELKDEGLDMTLVEQLDIMSLDDPKEPKIADIKSLFVPTAISTKILFLIEKIRDIRSNSDSKNPSKCVIVSQWTKMLDIVAAHLKNEGINYHLIQGNIPPKTRSEMVEDFNTNRNGPEVMLLSLRAGGVGLNLIGGNNLFIMDIHWNPALEAQACDRIYRVGQKKDVHIHKFICKDTVEERILSLQKKKMELANNVLTGADVKLQKLSLNDLKMLFGLEQPSVSIPTPTLHPSSGGVINRYKNAPFNPPGSRITDIPVNSAKPSHIGLDSSRILNHQSGISRPKLQPYENSVPFKPPSHILPQH